MSHKQHWPLSQDLNKQNGQRSVCFAYWQSHLSDGLIHLHDPRNNPCSGSNNPPLHSAITVIALSILRMAALMTCNGYKLHFRLKLVD